MSKFRSVIYCLAVIQVCSLVCIDTIYVQTVATSFHRRSGDVQHQLQPLQQRPKSNSITERLATRYIQPLFKDDADISRYVKLHGVEFMLWRCKNAIQPLRFKRKPALSTDLYCEVIGTMKSVAWFHDNKKISFVGSIPVGLQNMGLNLDRNSNPFIKVSTIGTKLRSAKETVINEGTKYSQSIQPHFVDQHGYYSRWIEFTLTIHNLTQRDAGLYIFQVTSPRGFIQQQQIFVDLTPLDVMRHQLQRKRRGQNHRNKKLRRRHSS